MLILASTQQPDYVALAMVLVLAVIVAIMAIRKRFCTPKAEPVQTVEICTEPVEEMPKPTAPGSAGQVKIHDVPPKTAAMLMAIVADKTGRSLNELRFISIKEVK